MLNIETHQDLMRAAAHLSRLTDEDPPQAVAEARQLRGKGQAWLSTQTLRAATLIDAGGQNGNCHAVREGIKILRKLMRKAPDEPELCYNLANGLSQLAKLKAYLGPEWYVTTHAERRKARCLYQEVANRTAPEQLRARALINLGNELDSGYRWVEAYDYWVQALKVDPTNPVAALSAARMLLRRLRGPTQYHSSTHQVAGYYVRIAAKHSLRIEDIAGRGAAETAESLRTFRSSWKPRTLYKLKDDFARFVAEHRLALVGTVEGLDLRKKRWDDVHIPTIIEKPDAGPSVPPVFAMFNQLKADFCTARWLPYTSQIQPLQDTSLYMDTLDYSLYGTGPSMLVLAQRAALDILDRVAVCANDYLGIGDKPNEIHFRTFWREDGGAGAWRSPIQAELSAGNPGIIALGELAADLCEGGPLALKHDLRNVSTHRFCVLHDLGDSPSRPCPAIEHYNIQSFFDQAIATLQVTRSAILYLLEAIAWREFRHRRDGPYGTLVVVPHHYIRGEN